MRSKHLSATQLLSILPESRIPLFLSGGQHCENSKACLHTVSPVKEGKGQISDTVSLFFFIHLRRDVLTNLH